MVASYNYSFTLAFDDGIRVAIYYSSRFSIMANSKKSNRTMVLAHSFGGIYITKNAGHLY